MKAFHFRPAVMADLPRIKTMYREIIADMAARQIEIWDDVYPCEFFEEDIHAGRLYILTHGSDIAAAFALSPDHDAAHSLPWKDECASAMYLDRLGVSVHYARRGVGRLMLAKAGETARALGAAYLRLFVVDNNTPAIRLYEKNGMTRVPGHYEEVIDDALTLIEYGYEAAL